LKANNQFRSTIHTGLPRLVFSRATTHLYSTNKTTSPVASPSSLTLQRASKLKVQRKLRIDNWHFTSRARPSQWWSGTATFACHAGLRLLNDFSVGNRKR